MRTRQKKSLIVGTMISLLCAFTGISRADPPKFKATASEWTKVSGVKHVHKVKFAPSKAKCGLTGFTVYEDLDAPHIITTKRHKMCYRNCKACTSSKPPKPQLRVPNAPSVPGVLPSFWDISLQTDHYITAIQVCLNNKKDASKKRIKGLKLWGASFNLDGSLKMSSTPRVHTLPNCKSWQPKVACPAGQIAIGIKGFYVSNTIGFAGLALRCASLQQLKP